MLVHDSIKTIVDGVWRRKWEIYYGIGTVSLLGNLIALFMRALDVNTMSFHHVCAIMSRCVVSKVEEIVVVFHSFIVPNVVVFHGTFILKHVVVLCELMTKRGVLFLIFNLILVVLMIKSGLLNKTLSHIIISSSSQPQEFPNWETSLIGSANSIGHPNPSSTHRLLCSSTTHPSEDQHRPSQALPDLAHPYTFFPDKETPKCPTRHPHGGGPIEDCHVAGHEVALLERGSYRQADVANHRPLVGCQVDAIVATHETSQHGPSINGCHVDTIVATHEVPQHGPSSHGCQVSNVVSIYKITQQEPVIACQVDNTIVTSPEDELSIACQVEPKDTPGHELIQDRPIIGRQVADNNFASPSLTLHVPVTRCLVDTKDTRYELIQHRQIIPSQTVPNVRTTHGSRPRGPIGGSYGEKRKSSKLSLFTIEPLEEVEDKDKVMEASIDSACARRDGHEMAHQELQETCGDNELEFKERIDNFISKFKRSLTIQRQESLTRLLALVGACPPPRPKLSFVHKPSHE